MQFQNILHFVYELPFHLWKPREDEFNLIISWIEEEPSTSLRNKLARIIAGCMNWGLCDDECFLPWFYHQKLAFAIAKAETTFVADLNSEGLIGHGVKQLSSALLLSSQTPEQLFRSWLMETVTKLHLHALDQEDDRCAKVNRKSWRSVSQWWIF